MGKIIRGVSRNTRQPITAVLVSAVKETIEGNTNKLKLNLDEKRTVGPLKAIVDTGATSTVISERVAKQLKLEPKGKTQFSTPSNKNVISNMYDIILGISLDEKINIKERSITANVIHIPLRVAESDCLGENCDVLLGMDIIMEGHLTVSHNMLVFSI